MSCISSTSRPLSGVQGEGVLGELKGQPVTGVCRTWGGKRAWHKRPPRAAAGTTSELGQTAAVSGVGVQ